MIPFSATKDIKNKNHKRSDQSHQISLQRIILVCCQCLLAVSMELGALFREQEGAKQVQPKGSDHFLEHLLQKSGTIKVQNREELPLMEPSCMLTTAVPSPLVVFKENNIMTSFLSGHQ